VHPLTRLLTRLRPLLSATFLKFAIVGASGVVVNLGALAVLSALGMRSSVASALAIELSIISNFIVNDRWTFAGQHHHSWPGRAVRFQLISLVGAIAQWTVFIVGNIALLWWLEGREGVSAWYALGGEMAAKPIVHPVVNPPEIGAGIYVSQLVGIGVSTGWNFFANLLWTWRAPPVDAPP
jgi:putative flippase GtrA